MNKFHVCVYSLICFEMDSFGGVRFDDPPRGP